jgi:hypothetical protein
MLAAIDNHPPRPLVGAATGIAINFDPARIHTSDRINRIQSQKPESEARSQNLLRGYSMARAIQSPVIKWDSSQRTQRNTED